MARTLRVTRSEVAAAKVLVALAEKNGRSVSPAVQAIADAAALPDAFTIDAAIDHARTALADVAAFDSAAEIRRTRDSRDGSV